jgi:two-component system chemotaxis response regulator CheY
MAKILVVDDSETLRSQLKSILEEQSHTIIEAENGLIGLKAIESDPSIELILCDVNMPEMDGLTMCERIFKSETLAKPPIFMLTTESSMEMKEKGKKIWSNGMGYKAFRRSKTLESC